MIAKENRSIEHLKSGVIKFLPRGENVYHSLYDKINILFSRVELSESTNFTLTIEFAKDNFFMMLFISILNNQPLE